MPRPVVCAAVFAAAGTLSGLPETRGTTKLLAVLLCIVLIFFIAVNKQRSSKRRGTAVFAFCAVFFLFVLRAHAASLKYRSEESDEFFSRYAVTVPGQFDYGIYLKSLGIANYEDYEAYLDDDDEASQSRGLPKYMVSAARNYISSKFDEHIDEEDAGIFKAILIGDRQDLSSDTKALYQAAGISHLLAISGLHVSILAGGMFGLLRKTKFRKSVSLILTSAFLLFYTILCGAQSSVIRASMMLFLSFAALACFRVYDMRIATALSLIVIIFINPYRLLASGTQLSFAAVTGIAFLSDDLQKGIEKRLKLAKGCRKSYTPQAMRLSPVFRAGILSLSIQLFMMPVLCYHYFTFPLYSFFLNFLVIPLMGIVLASGLTLLVFAILEDIALSFIPAAAGFFGILSHIAAAPGHYILKFYSLCCRIYTLLPHSTIVTGRPSAYLIFVYFLILFLLSFVLSHPGGKLSGLFLRKSGSFPIFRLSGGQFGDIAISRTAIEYMTLSFFIAVFLADTMLLRYYETEPFYIAAIDCGQGDGFIVREKDTVISIDCGSSSNKKLGERAIEPYLLSRRIEHIDLAVISHADQDHVSGIEYILSDAGDISVDRLALPAAARGNPEYDELRDLFLAAGGDEADIFYLKDLTRVLEAGDMRFTCIYAGNAEASDTNRHSDVCLLEKGDDFSMLFTGDAETADESSIVSLYEKAKELGLVKGSELTVLKAAHHGSSSSSSLMFLEEFSPNVAILSYGEGNSYGHPHEEVTDRMKALGIRMISTADNGTLMITESGIYPAL